MEPIDLPRLIGQRVIDAFVRAQHDMALDGTKGVTVRFKVGLGEGALPVEVSVSLGTAVDAD